MTEQPRRKKKRKKNPVNILINIVLVIAILCFAGSGAYLFKYFYDTDLLKTEGFYGFKPY